MKTLHGALRKGMETQEFDLKNIYLYVENPISGQDLKEYLEMRYLRMGMSSERSRSNKFALNIALSVSLCFLGETQSRAWEMMYILKEL